MDETNISLPDVKEAIEKIKKLAQEIGLDFTALGDIKMPPSTSQIKELLGKCLRTAFEKMGLPDPFGGATSLPDAPSPAFPEGLPSMPSLPVDNINLDFLKRG